MTRVLWLVVFGLGCSPGTVDCTEIDTIRVETSGVLDVVSTAGTKGCLVHAEGRKEGRITQHDGELWIEDVDLVALETRAPVLPELDLSWSDVDAVHEVNLSYAEIEAMQVYAFGEGQVTRAPDRLELRCVDCVAQANTHGDLFVELDGETPSIDAVLLGTVESPALGGGANLFCVGEGAVVEIEGDNTQELRLYLADDFEAARLDTFAEVYLFVSTPFSIPWRGEGQVFAADGYELEGGGATARLEVGAGTVVYLEDGSAGCPLVAAEELGGSGG